MKKRIFYLVTIFFALTALMVLQKPLFMLYNGMADKGVSVSEVLQVMLHGATLDAAMAGYLVLLPWLVTAVSIWTRRISFRRWMIPYYIIASLLMAVCLVVDMGLYPFWGFKLDASVFLYLDSPGEAMASVSAAFIAVRVAAMLGLSAFYAWLLAKLTPEVLTGVACRVKGTLAMLMIGGVMFVVIRGGVTESTSNVGQVYFSSNQYLNHSAVNPAFSLLSSMGKQKDFASEFDFFEESQRDEWMQGLYPTADGDSTLRLLKTTRPDVLLILMEGFGGAFIEPLGGLSDVAPNLNKLAGEGVFFSQCYANSFRTDRGTVCTLSGYLGLPTASVMKIPAKSRTLPAISEELGKAGYATSFLYGGDINFTNMKGYLLSKGYQHLTADTDFSLSEQAGNAWGVNDHVTAAWLLEYLTATQTESPRFTTWLTLSSHEPFEVPYNRLDDKILNAFAYTDHCIGTLIDGLKQSPVWENLLVVLIPDHGFCYPQGSIDRGGEYSRIPMIWTGGAVQQPMLLDVLMNQADLASTLLAQLELDHSMFTFSRNVLGSAYTYPFAFHTSGSTFTFRDSTGVTGFDTKALTVSYEEPSPDKNRLNRGKAILQTVYDDLGAR